MYSPEPGYRVSFLYVPSIPSPRLNPPPFTLQRHVTSYPPLGCSQCDHRNQLVINNREGAKGGQTLQAGPLGSFTGQLQLHTSREPPVHSLQIAGGRGPTKGEVGVHEHRRQGDVRKALACQSNLEERSLAGGVKPLQEHETMEGKVPDAKTSLSPAPRVAVSFLLGDRHSATMGPSKPWAMQTPHTVHCSSERS